jgi:hypothetical protein
MSAAVFAGCATNLGLFDGVNRLGQMSGLQWTDEEQITVILDDVHVGMQTRQIYKVLSHVSRNYYDEQGRDYAAMEQYLGEIFKKYKEIKITRVAPRVMVFGATARAIETFGTSADPQDPATEPPIHLQGQVSVNFEKVDGEWKIVEWGEML